MTVMFCDVCLKEKKRDCFSMYLGSFIPSIDVCVCDKCEKREAILLIKWANNSR